MPAFVPALVSWWAALYGGSAILRTFVAFVHIAGIVGGGGAAVVVNRTIELDWDSVGRAGHCARKECARAHRREEEHEAGPKTAPDFQASVRTGVCAGVDARGHWFSPTRAVAAA